MNWLEIVAQAAGDSGGGQRGAGGILPMLPLFAIIFVVFYLLLIRPQRKKDKDRRQMLEKLQKNDEVVTIGGIHGTVISVRENSITIRVADNVVFKMRRSAISRIITGDEQDQED